MFTKRRITVITTMFLLLFFIGCIKNYKGVVVPKSNGILITTTSSSEVHAIEGAKKEAAKYAKENGATYVVIDGPTTTYEGPDKKGKTGVGNAVIDGFKKRDKSQDYKCVMIIELKK